MPISFVRSITFANPKLNALHKFLVLCIFIVLVVTFFSERQYLEEHSLNTRLDVCPHMPTVMKMKEAAPKCPTSNTCIPLCGEGGETRCIEQFQSFSMTNYNEIFIVKSIASALAPEGYSDGWQFDLTMATDALQVIFGLSYKLSRDPVNFFGNVFPSAGSHANVLTVLVNKKGDVLKKTDGEMLALTIVEILSAAENVPHDIASSLPDIHPSLRTTGAELKGWIDCFSLVSDSKLAEDHDVVASIDRPICVMRFRFVGSDMMPSTAKADLSKHYGAVNYHEYRGLRIRTEPGAGFVRFPSIEKVVSAIVNAMVLLGIPIAVVKFVATKCLGRLSVIYNQLINQPFHIAHYVGGLATRLTSYTVPFKDFSGQLSKPEMLDRLRKVLQTKDGSISDIRFSEFIDFCYRGAVCGRSSDTSNANLDLSVFSMACSTNEILDPKAVLNMYADYKPHFLERFFMPFGLGGRTLSDTSLQAKQTIEDTAAVGDPGGTLKQYKSQPNHPQPTANADTLHRMEERLRSLENMCAGLKQENEQIRFEKRALQQRLIDIEARLSANSGLVASPLPAFHPPSQAKIELDNQIDEWLASRFKNRVPR